MKNKVLLFIIWCIMLLSIMTVGFDLISWADTFANILGIVIIVGFAFLSLTTKCFTDCSIINYKKDNENKD